MRTRQIKVRPTSLVTVLATAATTIVASGCAGLSSNRDENLGQIVSESLTTPRLAIIRKGVLTITDAGSSEEPRLIAKDVVDADWTESGLWFSKADQPGSDRCSLYSEHRPQRPAVTMRELAPDIGLTAGMCEISALWPGQLLFEASNGGKGVRGVQTWSIDPVDKSFSLVVPGFSASVSESADTVFWAREDPPSGYLQSALSDPNAEAEKFSDIKGDVTGPIAILHDDAEELTIAVVSGNEDSPQALYVGQMESPLGLAFTFPFTRSIAEYSFDPNGDVLALSKPLDGSAGNLLSINPGSRKAQIVARNVDRFAVQPAAGTTDEETP